MSNNVALYFIIFLCCVQTFKNLIKLIIFEFVQFVMGKQKAAHVSFLLKVDWKFL